MSSNTHSVAAFANAPGLTISEFKQRLAEAVEYSFPSTSTRTYNKVRVLLLVWIEDDLDPLYNEKHLQISHHCHVSNDKMCVETNHVDYTIRALNDRRSRHQAGTVMCDCAKVYGLESKSKLQKED